MTFVDFWTNKNNPSLPKSEYLYNTRHIIVLIITVIACISLSIIFRKKEEKTKQLLFKIFAWIFLFFEVLSRLVNLIITSDYSLGNIAKIILPMHICSVVVVLIIIAIFTKNKLLINFTAICGLLSTLAFLLYPAVGLNRVFMSFTCIYSTFTHMLGFVCCIL
ncbi:MAG: YwaF family protein, partial [Clostridia bacterium]|nr:YwaF family protein [Clostridia bacterium]